MLIVEVVQPKVVRLKWLPPVFKNGELKSYIINYTNQAKDSSKDIIWKSIKQTGMRILYNMYYNDQEFSFLCFCVFYKEKFCTQNSWTSAAAYSKNGKCQFS